MLGFMVTNISKNHQRLNFSFFGKREVGPVQKSIEKVFNITRYLTCHVMTENFLYRKCTLWRLLEEQCIVLGGIRWSSGRATAVKDIVQGRGEMGIPAPSYKGHRGFNTESRNPQGHAASSLGWGFW